MGTEQDHQLREVLTRLNTVITTFSRDLVTRKLDQEADLGMALMLLDAADQTLKHLVDDDAP